MTYDDVSGTLYHENFEDYVKDGTFFSKAVLGLFQDKIVDVFFLYGYDNITKIIYQPVARIAADSSEQTLEYYHKTDEKPFNSTLPENFVSKIPFDETYEKCAEIYGDCYCKIREFAFKSDLTEEQKTILKDYVQAFDYIINDELKPFYYELSPEFWEWLVKNAG